MHEPVSHGFGFRCGVGVEPWLQLGKTSEQSRVQCMQFESQKAETGKSGSLKRGISPGPNACTLKV